MPPPNLLIYHIISEEECKVEKKKMGRPTNDPKTHELKIRMSDSYMEKLEYCQNRTGKTRVEVIREGIDEVYRKLNSHASHNAPP